MHQDQRIGLALAVLLIGAAGAFFFRNDPQPAGSTPRLKTARELDARIAEKAISPYLQSGDDRDTPGVAAKKVGLPNATDASAFPQLDVPDFFGPEDQQATGQPSNSGNNGIQDLAPIPVPNRNDGSSQANSDPAERTGNFSTTEKMHIVQKGETLSSIAAKELGSSGRFNEVFEANRDQLKDANDVRVGMSLRIPTRRSGDSAVSRTHDRLNNAAPPLLPTGDNRADVGELPPIAVDPDKQLPVRGTGESPAKKKFEPAKRPPLGIKSMGTQSSEVEPQNKPIRKLSQLPPGNAGGKVAR